MAYTLGDPFRSLRVLLRINAILLGLFIGFCFLLLPDGLLVNWGGVTMGAVWPLRLAGASQIAIGFFLLIASGQDYMSRILLFTATLTHTLWAVVLLLAYLQGGLVIVTSTGRLLFVFVFLLCLLGAVIPLRYIRSSMYSNRNP